MCVCVCVCVCVYSAVMLVMWCAVILVMCVVLCSDASDGACSSVVMLVMVCVYGDVSDIQW